MKKEIIIDGLTYQLKEKAEDLKLIIGLVDNRGLCYVGYSNLLRNDKGFIEIKNAQCIIQWYTNAHLNYLINGVCEGVTLGATADILVSELYQVIELSFDTIEKWKATKIKKGSKEVL